MAKNVLFQRTEGRKIKQERLVTLVQFWRLFSHPLHAAGGREVKVKAAEKNKGISLDSHGAVAEESLF